MKKLVLTLCICSGFAYADSSVEVLHGWSSGGEAAAVEVLKKNLLAQGIEWNDLKIAGAAGANAQNYLRVRAAFGNPPTAVQMGGTKLTEWASEGVMANINSVAQQGKWDEIVPPALQKFSKYDGQWIASPVGIHRTNWIWANKQIFDDLGIDVPKTFNDLMAAARMIESYGYVAFAGGGQTWQEVTIFDSAVLSAGGINFYRKAFGDLDYNSLNSATMASAFDQLREYRTHVDVAYPGRDWNKATEMVMQGEAAMQIMGDWAKGEFINNGKIPNQDFLCFQYPGTEGSFVFNSDQFGMFDVSQEKKSAQDSMAKAVMDPGFQAKFNQVKGSVPPNLQVSDEGFDACAKKSMADLKLAVKQDTMVGSIAHGHMVSSEVQSAIYMVVGEFMSSNMKSQDAAKVLADAIAFLK
ncbi:sugar ABC transporter substrate-binding protein [Vibrio galatheae]|uniref:Probable sugar-binding periplasmic protein n=1 Tax=Vibrio galatheae TaxID=579748 RepID=A0A0F4NIH7_9VIBR|nr:ABC transporter substrate-binding protein [Vibrio galatheae]KJY82917.1 sugar ABC transporter substrate-binding protein [Vibrio galatheae]